MRYEYFGDSYDIVKRSLIGWLGSLGPWSVQPLFTDDVAPEQAVAFARFLGARLVEPFRARSASECTLALEACRGKGNLLVDPDTGVVIRQAGRRVGRTHLSTAVVQTLCLANPDHLVLSFDQALRRAAPEDSLRSKIAWLSMNHIAAAAYYSHASFLLCSTNTEQLGNAVRLLLDTGLPEWRILRETTS